MSLSAPSRVLHAGDQPPAEPISLRAGPLTMLYDNGDLRYIKFGEIEVIRRIYAAVRDRDWNTILGQLRNVRIDQGRDFFHITYESEHSEADISFVWRGEITGDADGTIRITFDGEARSTFLKNRIGFCILHPIRECAGQKCWIEYVDGTKGEILLPELVAAEQPVCGVHDLAAISHELPTDLRAEIRFEGDLFEMEDQRNWIDASFKTFCTPLRLPYPVEIQSGTRIQQSVTLRLVGNIPMEMCATEQRLIRIDVRPAETFPIPPIGLGVPSYLEPYSSECAAKLRELNLSHLRVDLDLTTDWVPTWKHALLEATELDLPLEIALTFPENGHTSLAHLLLEQPRRIKRLIIFTKGAKSTKPKSLHLARKTFKDVAPIGIGTNADFYQLNQSRPPWHDADFICWSMNPQVHAFDNTSIMETPEAVPAQIESARVYFGGKPVIISPITLRPRFNPVATSASAAKTKTLPPDVDPRQRTPFAAAWTLAILKQLIESRVESITFYETVGWRGVMAGDYPSSLPDLFPSRPAELFPVYLLFHALAPFRSGDALRTASTDSRRVESILLRKNLRRRVLVANLSPTPRHVATGGPFSGLLAPYEFSLFDPP